MKKIYIAPNTVLKTVNFKRTLLAGSGDGRFVSDQTTGNAGITSGDARENNGWAQSSSVWDD